MKRLMMNFAVSASMVAAFLVVQGCGPEKRPVNPDTGLPEEEIEVQVLDDNTGKPAPKATATTKKPAATSAKATAKAPAASGTIDIQSVIGTTPYTVQKGDTLSAIAARYGVRWQDIIALNPGLKPNLLRVGQVIQLPGQHAVPAPKATTGKPAATTAPAKTTAPAVTSKEGAAKPATGGVYIVKKNDVLGTIAVKHGVKLADLRAVNPQLKGDKILVGQKLNLPAGAKNVAVTAKDAKPAATTAKKPAPKKTVKAKETPKTTAATVTPPVLSEKKPVETKPEEVKVETPAPKAPEAPKAVETPKATETTATPAGQTYETYTVKGGEDVYAVAIRWGVSPSDLKSLNNLTSNELKEGQVLKLPKSN